MRVASGRKGGTIALSLVLLAFMHPVAPSVAQSTGQSGSGSSRDSDALERGADAAPAPDSYLLDTGDHLRIRFYDRYDRDDLNGEYVIGEAGQLRLPRIGAFNARRRTPEQLERDIRASVEKKGEKIGYFSLDVSRCRPFYIVGLVDHPGAYAYSPGFTVLHAISTAGGLYRPPAGERISVIETMSRRAALLARKARLLAEKDGSGVVKMPKELAQLELSEAADMIAREQAILDQTRLVSEREKLTFQNLVRINENEAEGYKNEIAKLEQRIVEQTQIYDQLKTLHENKVINQQRFFESVAALDNLRRDRRSAGANLALANSNLERSKRDLAMLKLAESARIAREIGDTEGEIDRLKITASQFGDLSYGMDAASIKSKGGMMATYKIVRRNENGQADIIKANETTVIMPGDIIEVGSSRPSEPSQEGTPGPS